MGNKLFCCRKSVRKKIVLLMVGLDNAGKTATAKGLAGESSDSTVPTVGFSAIYLKYGLFDVKIYDLGGGSSIRGIWNTYFSDVHGVIFVVDSSDFSRFVEAKHVLTELLHHKKIAGKPLLILANKQDHQNALDEIDVIEQLDVERIVNLYECPTLVQSCAASEHTNAKIDDGIGKGYAWLMKFVIRNYDSLNNRVAGDIKEQEQLNKEIMAERRERIRKLKEREQHQQDIDAIESYSDYARKMNGETVHSNNLNADDEPFATNSLAAVHERPKSAVQIVSQHLQMNQVKKSKFKLPTRKNKTAPMAIFGQRPQSAKSNVENSVKKGKRVKSADSSKNKADGQVFSLSNLKQSLINEPKL